MWSKKLAPNHIAQKVDKAQLNVTKTADMLTILYSPIIHMTKCLILIGQQETVQYLSAERQDSHFLQL